MTRTIIVASILAVLLTACDKPTDTPAAGATGATSSTTPDKPAGLEGIGGHVKK
jgi:hypothetical protein